MSCWSFWNVWALFHHFLVGSEVLFELENREDSLMLGVVDGVLFLFLPF
jgi:hypothetical protein